MTLHASYTSELTTGFLKINLKLGSYPGKGKHMYIHPHAYLFTHTHITKLFLGYFDEKKKKPIQNFGWKIASFAL